MEGRKEAVIHRRYTVCSGQQGEVMWPVAGFLSQGTQKQPVLLVVVMFKTLLGVSAHSQEVVNVLKEACVECYGNSNKGIKY